MAILDFLKRKKSGEQGRSKEQVLRDIENLKREYKGLLSAGNDEKVLEKLYEIGLTYQIINENQQALLNYQDGLKLAHETGDALRENMFKDRVSSLDPNAMAMQTEQAIERLNLDRVHAQLNGDRQGEGNALSQIALQYELLGDKTEAISHWKNALEIAIETGNSVATASIRERLSNLES